MNDASLTSNQHTFAELIEQARKWPDDIGEGVWFNAMANVMLAQRDTALDRDREIERLRAALEKIAYPEKAGWRTQIHALNLVMFARSILEAAPSDETCTCGNGSIPGPAHHPTCSAYFEPAPPDETKAEQRS